MIRPFALLLGLLQSPAPATAPDYPFSVGETLSYSAKLGMITLGSGTLHVAAIDTVHGEESFRLRFQLEGKTVVYSLNDVLESWVSTRNFTSRRFVQDFVENDKPRYRLYEIFPDSGYYRESDKAGKDTTHATVAEPLDDAAFFYFVRITPLEVGKKYVFDAVLQEGQEPGDHRGPEAGKDGAPRRAQGGLPCPAPDHRHEGALLEALRHAPLAH